MRQRLLVLPVLLLAGLALAGESSDRIAWHTGDPQAAFERAKHEAKPLFLYWGAVWCPPCNQIKKTIFTRREFVEKTALFIPVYLDGDTESAQVWADKLGVSGYPTMLVMSPEGREVMRLPTGLQVEEFVQVLDEALGRMTPISEILETVLSSPDPQEVPDRSYRLLAYHSWQRSGGSELSEEEQVARFRTLAERVPLRLTQERSRLYLEWLRTAASLAAQEPEKGKKKFKLPKKLRREADVRLHEILESPELTTANLELLSYEAAEVVPLIHPKNSPARRALGERWLRTMLWVEQNESFSVDERLSALLPAIQFHELQNGTEAEIDAGFQQRLRDRVAWANESARDPYTRQAAVSSAGYLLRRAGLTEDARQLYLAEIETSESPYYFMSSLAGLAEKDGDPETAVAWLAKAYAASKGRATRFQWGTRYLLGLMELMPDSGDRIRSESVRVLEELLGFDDAFAGRNQLRASWLSDGYRKWNAGQAHRTEVAALRAELLPNCSGLSDEAAEGEESLRSRCSEFFTGLGAE